MVGWKNHVPQPLCKFSSTTLLEISSLNCVVFFDVMRQCSQMEPSVHFGIGRKTTFNIRRIKMRKKRKSLRMDIFGTRIMERKHIERENSDRQTKNFRSFRS